MTKKMFIMAAMAACLTACQKVDLFEPATGNDAEVVSDASPSEKTKKFTFTIKGDFTDDWKPVTRAYLQADGRDLTDVWVLDYMNGALVQQLHQNDNTAADFGKPVLNLAYGNHHVYFIASRGTLSCIDTDAKTMLFSKALDTFYKDYEVSVVSTSNGNRAVTLDRIVTRLRLTFTDAIPSNAATFNIMPATWYYGWNFATGTPFAAASSQPIVINIPSSSIGISNEHLSIYGFSGASEWTTDINFNSKDIDGNVIGQATITDAPFMANRSTEYSGPLFGSPDSEVSVSLNSTWSTPTTGTW